MWRKSPWLMLCEWEWSLSLNNRYVHFTVVWFMIITKNGLIFLWSEFSNKTWGVAAKVIIVLFCFFTLPMWESQVISSRICLERKLSFLTSNFTRSDWPESLAWSWEVYYTLNDCLIVRGVIYKMNNSFLFSFGSQLFSTYEFFFSVHHVPQCSLGA